MVCILPVFFFLSFYLLSSSAPYVFDIPLLTIFTVQALYDYTATIDEEFDFQAGDVIAVTATPEDGWWSGILLDDHRRQRGKHVFPSNFVFPCPFTPTALFALPTTQTL